MSKDKTPRGQNDHRDSLNLPQTALPMKANLAAREPAMLEKWQKLELYQTLRKARHGREQFILHDGPPYANGAIHIGHALNKILKDVIVKSRSMEGLDAPYVPGWDCHGLPIEQQVEKKHGRAGDRLDAADFVDKCRRFARRQIDDQRRDFIRLGVLGDWDAPYITMAYPTEANIVRALGRIIGNGHLVRDCKPVYWSIAGRSAMAEAEVEYRDKQSCSVDVGYSLVAGQEDALADALGCAAGALQDAAVAIWTTTPWTLPCSQAVAAHPDFDYLLAELCGRRLFVAEGLLQATATRLEADGAARIIGKCKGAQLAGLQLQHPFYDKRVPLLTAAHVTLDDGTGFVHTSPDHGPDDFRLCRKHGIELLDYVDEAGVYRPQVPHLAGVHVYKADAPVLALLKEHGSLLGARQIQHSYPHCWRSKTPLIYRAARQWFISMGRAGLLDGCRKALDEVQWIPEWGRRRMQAMLDSSPDWCLSRQRIWGVPMPLFVRRDDDSLHPRTQELIEQVAQRMEREGMGTWAAMDAAELLGDEADDYEKVGDTMDVWFDSGTTHLSVLRQNPQLRFPADLYLEGSDQHRGWFQSSLKTSMAIHGCPPYRQVLTHGFTVDGEGRKMSKSIGNVVSPQAVVGQLGADVLRLWVAATDFSAEMSCSDEILSRTADAYRRIRNTCRYLLGNLHDFDPAQSLPPQQMVALDAWLVERCAAVQEQLREHYHHYRLHRVYQLLHRFCITDLGNFYLDLIKDRAYTCKADSQARRSAQSAMHLALGSLCRWMAPVLSFTADEIWPLIPGVRQPSVHLDQYQELPQTKSALGREQWARLVELREQANLALEGARNSGTIGGALDARVRISTPPDELLETVREELHFLLLVSAVELDSAPADAGLRIEVLPAEGEKCARCWHINPGVGQDVQHPDLCQRCIANVFGDGEQRRFF